MINTCFGDRHIVKFTISDGRLFTFYIFFFPFKNNDLKFYLLKIISDISHIFLTSNRSSQKVNVWADLAKEIDKLYDQTMEEPIIAIVTSTKMKVFKSKLFNHVLSSI